jgi:hypothetical protein
MWFSPMQVRGLDLDTGEETWTIRPNPHHRASIWGPAPWSATTWRAGARILPTKPGPGARCPLPERAPLFFHQRSPHERPNHALAILPCPVAPRRPKAAGVSNRVSRLVDG